MIAHCPNIAQKTNLTTRQIWDFQAPLTSSFQIIFFDTPKMIKRYKTNKRTWLYHDMLYIWGIIAVQIWQKMSLFPNFWTYAL